MKKYGLGAVLVVTAMALSIVLSRHFSWPSLTAPAAVSVSEAVDGPPLPEVTVDKAPATSGLFRRWRSK